MRGALQLRRLCQLLSCLFALFALSCRDPQGPTEPSSLCGDGELSVSYGYGRPMTQLEGGALSIEYGLQGGYHVDVSLRFEGELNPDLVDVSMSLEVVEGQNSAGVNGRHQTEAWYLIFPDEGEAVGCYFYRARVFLFDGAGEIPTESMVEGLDGATALLKLRLTHEVGELESQERFPLRFIPPSP